MTAMKKRVTDFHGKDKMRVGGLMSGTSADGVDAVVVDIHRNKVKVLAFDTFPYSTGLRHSILGLCKLKPCNVADICHLNFVLGEVFAQSIITLCRKNGIDIETVDLLGSHGQTIYHNPKGRRFGGRILRSTLQIGEPSVIAQRTGITTVADFRPRDMAANGQGAPLVPFADYVLFRDKQRTRAVQNIGGIANVTYLPAGCRLESIVAFDTGPGNMIIDGLVSLISRGRRKFDWAGRLAGRGRVDEGLLKDMLRHPFLRRRPPKSTGREEFGRQYSSSLQHRMMKKSLSGVDMMATATAFTAAAIAQAYQRFLPQMPDEVILCGGGARNRTLVEMLRQRLEATKILMSDDLGISCDAKEAVSFAILAHATVKGVANNVPSATGAKQPLVLGKIVPA
ncbi:MAG TPA: anhydro-N-acetylmuramic acid kinase [Sedimentisphaerales bacterium]|nr:anhydro-N-acetylmuramic acid kinase [Sedimentisphaerales bacterium]